MALSCQSYSLEFQFLSQQLVMLTASTWFLLLAFIITSSTTEGIESRSFSPSFEHFFPVPRTEKDWNGIKKDLLKLSEPISKLIESWDKLSSSNTVSSEPESAQAGEKIENSNRLNYEYEEDMPQIKSNEEHPSYYPDPGKSSHCTIQFIVYCRCLKNAGESCGKSESC